MTRYPFYRRLGGRPGRSGQVRKTSPHTVFFFVFSCTLYFIRTCIFVFTVTHFAFCLYLQHRTQTSMSSAGFEPTIPASHRPHTLTLASDRSAIGIGFRFPDRSVRSQSLYRLSYPAHSGRKTWDNCIISVFLSHWRDRRVGKASRVGENLFHSERASAHNTQIFEPRWYPLAKYLFVQSGLKIS